jgi:hypothetical protein
MKQENSKLIKRILLFLIVEITYTSSQKQTEKVLFLLEELLKSQPNNNPWRLKHFGFSVSDEDENCEMITLIFVDKSNLMIYSDICRDNSHSYYSVGKL